MRAPKGARGDFDQPTYGEPHQSRQKRGYSLKDSEAALSTRVTRMDAMDRKRARDVVDAMDTSETSPKVRGDRCRVDDLHLAFAAE